MKIARITSQIPHHDLREELGLFQQYCTCRTAHPVKVKTGEGVTGRYERFGLGNVAIAIKGIVEKVSTHGSWR